MQSHSGQKQIILGSEGLEGKLSRQSRKSRIQATDSIDERFTRCHNRGWGIKQYTTKLCETAERTSDSRQEEKSPMKEVPTLCEIEK